MDVWAICFLTLSISELRSMHSALLCHLLHRLPGWRKECWVRQGVDGHERKYSQDLKNTKHTIT